MANAIRANIPDCRQTNAKFFPDYEYREYPKQMIDEFGAPIINDPIYLMTTPPMNSSADPEKVMRKGADGIRRPVLIGGTPAVVHDGKEEAEFLRDNPNARAVSISVVKEAPVVQMRRHEGSAGMVRPAVPAVSDALAAARAEIAELEALAARKAELMAQIGGQPAPKKRGPKPKQRELAPPAAADDAAKPQGENIGQTLAEFASGE